MDSARVRESDPCGKEVWKVCYSKRLPLEAACTSSLMIEEGRGLILEKMTTKPCPVHVETHD